MITSQIPGGNIKVVSMNGHDIELDVELRDTEGDWFYWSFKMVFPETGRYRFRFTRDWKVGTHGPAVSFDGGRNWQWLYPEYYDNTREFDYGCTRPGEEVLFCVGMQYLQQDLKAFLTEFAGNPALPKSPYLVDTGITQMDQEMNRFADCLEAE